MDGNTNPYRLSEDARLGAIGWADLVHLTRRERLFELLRPCPWLALSLWAAAHQYWPLALGASFYFFLTGLRLVHDVFHGNLGLTRRQNDMLLVLLGAAMLGSMHAVRWTHLQHHRDCLGEHDVEGATARRSGALALLGGAMFPIALHRAALRGARPHERVWMMRELAFTAILLAAAFTSGLTLLRYHVGVMIVGQALSGFFAVWTVHHDCDRWAHIARTLRHRFKSAVACNMFFHLEHHLFPRVPTCHLPTLAARLDRALPVEHRHVY